MEGIHISVERIKDAERVLVDNGVEEDEAQIVLQALGYVLLDQELFPEETTNSN